MNSDWIGARGRGRGVVVEEKKEKNGTSEKKPGSLVGDVIAKASGFDGDAILLVDLSK